MSAQAYTNKRRTQAEASLLKVQYPGRVALNTNSLYSSRNCLPNFQQLNYVDNICCKFRRVVQSAPGLGSILDGQNSGTNAPIILDGGNSGTNSTTILDGGNS